MSSAQYTAKEIAERGEALLRQRIARDLDEADQGKFVVIDIESGDYEIGEDDLAATKRVLARRPGALTYGIWIGHTAAYRLGAGMVDSGRVTIEALS